MKKNRAFKLLILVAFVLMNGATFAQNSPSTPQTHYFTAKQAVDYAMEHAIVVKNALLDIEYQRQVNKEITASALPSLSLNVAGTYNPKVSVQMMKDFISPAVYGVLIDNQVKDGNGQPIQAPSEYGYFPVGFGAKYAGSAGIDFRQILFDGQVFVGLQARNAAIKNAEITAEVTKEQIKANVYKVYYQLVVGQRQITTFDANIANYEKLLHDTKEIYKNGFAEKLDVDKVQVQLINLQTQRLKAQNQLLAGIEGLKFLLNIPPNDQLVLTETLTDEDIKSNLLDEDYNPEDRVEYKQLESLLELGEYNIKRYKLSKLPTLTLLGNYSESGQWQNFDFFKGPYYNSSFISLRLSFSLFDGGAKNAKIAQTKIDYMKLMNNLDLLKFSISNDVTQSRIEMKTALYNMDAQRKNIELALQVYNTTKLKYEQGLGSNLEISTAQADLVTAQNNYYSSIYDAIIAKINYLKATGKL